KITYIVGDGQVNFTEQISFKGNASGYQTLSTTIEGAVLDPENPFTGVQGFSWDNPTFNVSSLVQENAGTVYTQVLPLRNNSDCLSWGALVFSTPVKDTDGDGLLDTWEDGQGYTDAKSGSFVPLPGANANAKDLFIQVDYMKKNAGSVHSHSPKQSALDSVSAMYLARGIRAHFDVRNPIDAIDEDSLVCTDSATRLCQFPGQSGIVSWKTGFNALKNRPLNYPDEATCRANTPPNVIPGQPPCVRRFDRARKDSYRYVLFGHSLGRPSISWSTVGGPPTPLLSFDSIVVSGTTATVTTTFPHGLTATARLTIAGASVAAALNGSYTVQTAPAPNRFTITVAGVAAGTYTRANEKFLSLSPLTNLFSVTSIADAGNTATVTTTAPHGLIAGARVNIGGVIGQFDLNGRYVIQSVPTPTTFTILTSGVADAVYSQLTNEPGLVVAPVTLVSLVNAATVATITTRTSHGLYPGARVSVSGAIGNRRLNRTYTVQAVPSSNTFTISTVNVGDGTWDAGNEPALTVAWGAPKSSSGHSDFGGADSLITLGGWLSD